MIKAEYRCRLIRYQKTNQTFEKKYGMTNKKFESKNIVAELGYSWEVESDAQEWEAALDSIETINGKLREIGVEYPCPG